MGSDGDAPTAVPADIALPKSTVNKFANDIAASLQVRLSPDTRELIANCCTEFVQLLSSEANEICEKDSKKTITPEHVLRALSQLGLDRFRSQVEEEYQRARTEDKTLKARANAKKDRDRKAEINSEELLKKQQELFAMARSDPMAMTQHQHQPE